MMINSNHYATSQKQAKQAALSIDPLAFQEFVIQDRITKAVKCIKGIPSDAEFIRYVWTGESLALIFEHESFDMCHVGWAIPFLELEFEDI